MEGRRWGGRSGNSERTRDTRLVKRWRGEVEVESRGGNKFPRVVHRRRERFPRKILSRGEKGAARL